MLNNPIQLADLQNLLQGITPGSTDQSGSKFYYVANKKSYFYVLFLIKTYSSPTLYISVDLSSAFTADALSGLLTNTEAIEQLQNHLPAVDGSTQEQLRSTLASPQFQQAVSQFSSALQSGQLGPIVSQFAVNPDAVSAAAQGNMREFVRALERNTEEGKEQKPAEGDKGDKEEKKKDGGNEPKKDDDEGMQLD